MYGPSHGPRELRGTTLEAFPGCWKLTILFAAECLVVHQQSQSLQESYAITSFKRSTTERAYTNDSHLGVLRPRNILDAHCGLDDNLSAL
jgi:hypothetical protein